MRKTEKRILCFLSLVTLIIPNLTFSQDAEKYFSVYGITEATSIARWYDRGATKLSEKELDIYNSAMMKCSEIVPLVINDIISSDVDGGISIRKNFDFCLTVSIDRYFKVMKIYYILKKINRDAEN